MGNVEIPNWLLGLPLAPIYYPTETEFADPIAYISKIEKEARAFGICKVVPPLPKPSKRYVLSNLNKSLAKSQELGSGGNGRNSICRNMGSVPHSGCGSSQLGHGSDGEVRAIFTTRHQELGCSSRRIRGTIQSVVHRQVWESGGRYTLDQFESKSKIFARNQLGAQKDVSPLVVETLFWKAASEKPIYVEYANDVPGSGFGEPDEPFRYSHKRNRKRKFDRRHQDSISCEKQDLDSCKDFNADKKESSSTLEYDSDKKDPKEKVPPNLILEIAEACPCSLDLSIEDGSKLTRQKSLNTSSEREGTAGWRLSNSPWNLQVIARSPGSLTRFMPDEVPGVTSPMVYIGMLFSWFAWHVEDHELHSLNFLHVGSPKTWYGVPGDVASSLEEVIRVEGYGGDLDRLAALTILGEKTTLLSPEIVVASGIPCCRLVQNPGEFVVTFPRAYHLGFSHGFNCGEAANFATPQWLKVAKEAAVRRAAMNYLPMLSHQQLLYMLSLSFASSLPRALLPVGRSSRLRDKKKEGREMVVKKEFIMDIIERNTQLHILSKESKCYAVLWDPELLPCSPGCASPSFPLSTSSVGPVLLTNESTMDSACISKINYRVNDDGIVDRLDMDDDVLPSGLHVDSGPLVCVACGILGFPFMAIIQPSKRASRELFPTGHVENQEELKILKASKPYSTSEMDTAAVGTSSDDVRSLDVEFKVQTNMSLGKKLMPHNPPELGTEQTSKDCKKMRVEIDDSNRTLICGGPREFEVVEHMEVSEKRDSENTSTYPMKNFTKTEEGVKSVVGSQNSQKSCHTWNLSEGFLRPRIFCLEHALEVVELLKSKGGANVLIICHSDYPKIKEQAISIAKEIGVDFDCKDIPLVTASELDLGLIHLSIDDEEHVECGDDWTLKLCVNLQHCVNVRKLPLPKQEHHALALGGIFSEIVPGSNFSNLKWQSRKTRSRHKAAGSTNSKSRLNDQIIKDTTGGKLCLSEVYKEDHFDKDPGTFNNEKVMKEVKSSGRHRKDAIKEHERENAQVRLEPENNKRNPFGDADCSSEVAVGCSVKPDELPVISAISTVESSEAQHEIQVAEEIEVLESSLRSSEGQQETQIAEETKASKESSFRSSEGQQKIQIKEETKALEESFRNSEEHQEIQITEETNPSEESFRSSEGQQEIQITEETNPLHETCPKRSWVPQEIQAAEEINPLARSCSLQDGKEKDVQNTNLVPKSDPKKKFKRKREADQKTIAQCFVRGPCEGLRPRPGQASAVVSKSVKKEEKKSRRKEREDDGKNRNRCELQWCWMSFRTKGELALHKRNECVYKGCGKRFASHKYLVQHQCVHAEERPLKCPWKGCNMSFKWVWARTEHVRVHTGERPYVCTVVGCGRTFRFVSDFSRHKRKTGHNTS